MLDEHPVIFTNKKSKEFFACNLLDGDKEENYQKINEPCFIQVNSQDATLDLNQRPNPMTNAGRALMNRANKTFLSLK